MKKKLAAFGVLAVILVLGASLLPLRDWSQVLEGAIGRMNPVAGLVVFCAVAVTASLLLVPAWIFPLVAGAVFGLGWGLVAAVMSPAMPSGVKSYFLGLTRVKLPDYAVASVAGMFPGVLLKVYVGSAGRGALRDGGPLEWSLFAAGIVATIALTVIVGRKVRSRLNL